MKLSINLTQVEYEAAQALAKRAGLNVSSFARARLLSPDISELPAAIESASAQVVELVQADLIRFVQSIKP